MKYERKVKEVVEAVQYKGEISKEIIDFLSGNKQYFCRRDKFFIYDEFMKERPILKGDYIVKLPNGLLKCMHKEEFDAMYEKVG